MPIYSLLKNMAENKSLNFRLRKIDEARHYFLEEKE